MEVQEIRVELIEPNPKQPRREFNEDRLQELANSIAQVGLQEPIKVRPNGNGRFTIVMGERRWRAHTLAGLATVKALVEEMDDERMAFLALIENIQRVDLNCGEEGQYLQQLLDQGHTWDKIATTLGKERQYLEWKVDVVNKCVPEIVWLVKQGTLTGHMGWRLSKLSPNGQRRFIQEVNKEPKTLQEQIGLIEAVFATEHEIEMFPEVKLTEEQREAAVNFHAAIDKAIRACEKLEKMEQMGPGTLGAAMATELDLSVQKVGNLTVRLGGIQRSLQRRQGSLALGEEKVA